MQIETQAKLLSAESNPYEFDGKSGVSHRIRLNVDGEIYVCKSTAKQVESLKDFIKQDGTATILVESRKEILTLKLAEFVPE